MKSIYKPFALTLFLAIMSINIAAAVTPTGLSVAPAIVLQGGSDSAAKWFVPATKAYKVHVFVPKTGVVKNALYRVYPQGRRAGSTKCISTDAKFPCYGVKIDQRLHQNAWVQLMLNGDAATQWNFIRGKGYVAAVADNLAVTERLNVSGQIRFENMTLAIGDTHQGGIIFYLDDTGEHGLVAAPTDQSDGIVWDNGIRMATGAIRNNGQANTTKIINAQGTGSYAATLCADLVLGEYSDWFLPSSNELNLMYKNIGQGAAAPLTNVGGFTGGMYWSSSEGDYDVAVYQNFSNGSQGSYYNKGNTFAVRAVRAF